MLTDLKVKSFKKTGYYSDRDSLYLRVSTSGAKSWWHQNQNDISDAGQLSRPIAKRCKRP